MAHSYSYMLERFIEVFHRNRIQGGFKFQCSALHRLRVVIDKDKWIERDAEVQALSLYDEYAIGTIAETKHHLKCR